MSLVADVIVPLAVAGAYSYLVPSDAKTVAQTGMRVLIPVGKKKIYTGVILRLYETDDPSPYKEIAGFPEEKPSVTAAQLKHWQWLSNYYLCTIGEVMKAALPAPLKPESETRILLNPNYEAETALPDRLLRILDHLTDGKPHTLDELSRITGVKTLLPAVNTLLETGAVTVEERVPDKKSKKTTGTVRYTDTHPVHSLTTAQNKALQEVEQCFQTHNVTLLFGVTSSGKTDIYSHLALDRLVAGKQVLYLVPEIALTTQLTERLRDIFGDRLCVYHSRLTEKERADIYYRVAGRHQQAEGPCIVLGVRSALFLPFRDLGLVIVDEEHEPSYKQQDPAPRYHARDAAIVLASFFGAKTLLGTATPAIETYHNALSGKYGLVRLTERYQGLSLPTIRIIDLQRQYHRKEMYGHFSDPLFLRMKEEVEAGKQVILFQNRRGYSPYTECRQCAYVPKCVNCDVSLTLHRRKASTSENNTAPQAWLVCHYCGYTTPLPQICPSCKTEHSLAEIGFGTEKIEEEIQQLLPEARVARLDLDTTRNKNSHQRIINDFAEHKVDVLIGTQMVTKGLHFNDVSLVGVMRADTMLNQPDFRATERTYHMLEQVAGRAGRAGSEGEVFIQTGSADLPVFRWVQNHDYEAMYESQLKERMSFRYPPFYRLISVMLRHHESSRLDTAARLLQDSLRHIFGKRCSNIITPSVSRVKNLHQKQILLKIEKEADIHKAKELLKSAITYIQSQPQCKGTFIHCDVDPM